MPKTDDDFVEHLRTRTLHPPAVLYKYLNVCTAREILCSGKLRYSSPLRYNDPFDSQWDTFWPLFTPESREYERSLIEQSIRDPGSWPADADPQLKRAANLARAQIDAMPQVQREGEIARWLLELERKPGLREEDERRLLDIRRRMRILCLSSSDNSILMWSHYADQHRGVVLGFDSALLENSERRPRNPLEKVEYLDGPPALIDPEVWIRASTFGLPTPDLIGPERHWALTKHTGWKYEQEWRVVSSVPEGTLGDYGDFAFRPEALVAIVTGCRTDGARAKELQSLAYAFRRDVAHFKMLEQPGRFELVRTSVSHTP